MDWIRKRSEPSALGRVLIVLGLIGLFCLGCSDSGGGKKDTSCVLGTSKIGSCTL